MLKSSSAKPRVITPQSSVISLKIDVKRAQNGKKEGGKALHESRFCNTGQQPVMFLSLHATGTVSGSCLPRPTTSKLCQKALEIE